MPPSLPNTLRIWATNQATEPATPGGQRGQVPDYKNRARETTETPQEQIGNAEKKGEKENPRAPTTGGGAKN